jgi:hypothetical protein
MKKTLLIAAAALAAGIISTQAQPIYSQNIVGYVNQVIPGGGVLSLIEVPLSASPTNSGIEVLNALLGGETLYLWSGSGYYVYNYNAGAQAGGFPSDWTDGGGAPLPGRTYDAGTDLYFAPAPQLTPGKAFFIQNPNSTYTNTVAGSVVLSSTNTIVGGGVLSLMGSAAPLGGNIQTNAFYNLPLVGGETIYVWSGTGYYIYNYNAGAQAGGFPSDWTDGGGAPLPGRTYDAGTDLYFAPAPNIPVGGGYFFQNPNSTTNWIQNITLQ